FGSGVILRRTPPDPAIRIDRQDGKTFCGQAPGFFLTMLGHAQIFGGADDAGKRARRIRTRQIAADLLPTTREAYPFCLDRILTHAATSISANAASPLRLTSTSSKLAQVGHACNMT